MGRLTNITQLVFGYILANLVLGCICAPGIYLISPPTGASPRAENQRTSMEASESLWIGSHKINWSPLPLFLKFTNPTLYEEQKQHHAQARKFETKTPIIVAKKSFRSFDFDNDDRYNRPVYQHAPRHSNLLNGVGSFPDFPPRPQLPQPYLQSRSIANHNQQTEVMTYEGSVNREDVTTASPIFVSTSATLLVSPQQAVDALETPGSNIAPIADKLRKMTEWSKQHNFLKKEGRPTPVYPFQERKVLRLKKRTKKNGKKKQYKNIADIIAAKDEEDDSPPQSQTNTEQDRTQITDHDRTQINDYDRTQIIRPKRLNPKEEQSSNRLINDGLQPNYEDVFRPSTRANNFVIIHPTNAAFLIKDPLESPHQLQHQHQQSAATRQRQFVRKEKRLGLFKKEASSIVSGPSTMSFRFGPEDAKMSPYRF